MRNTFSYEATLLHIRNFRQYSSSMYIEEKEHLDELGGYLKASFICDKYFHEISKTLAERIILSVCHHNREYS